MNTKTLCDKYSPFDPRTRLVELFRDFDRVLVTSSFGITSAVLLHLIHEVRPSHPIYFLDTQYHFPETWAYMAQLIEDWGLNVHIVKPDASMHLKTKELRMWDTDSTACCSVNKVTPLRKLKQQHTVWISGLVGQTTHMRKQLSLFKHDGEILRFYPFLDMPQEFVAYYSESFELPPHPLSRKGYDSVGCRHCTLPGKGRSGRWKGTPKTECGLHYMKNQ